MNSINSLKGKIIAHRGVYDNRYVYENTIEAFEEAIELNLPIEFDVHILKDDTVVVFHDDNLYRLTKINKQLNKCSYIEIQNLCSTFNIPKFEDVLKYIDGRVPIIIEIKSNTMCFRIEKAVINILEKYDGFYVIQSFNPISLMYLKCKIKDILIGQLSCDFSNVKMNRVLKYILQNLYFNYILKPDFLSFDLKSMPNKYVNNFKKNKFVIGWNIQSKKELKQAKILFDAYICDNVLSILG